MTHDNQFPEKNMPIKSGNQGILDQESFSKTHHYFLSVELKTFKQMAMKWVREYIYYFGGDANRVTIGGMSAGGQSIQVHLMAPSSWPFFNKAISISGPTGVPLKNAEESGNCSRPRKSNLISELFSDRSSG